MTRPTGTVRNVRSQTTHGTRPVELYAPDPRGDLREGDLRVPRELVADMQDVQLKHRRTEYIAGYVKRWVEARERGALYPHYRTKLTGQPKVSGPFDAPTENPEAESPDWVIYRVRGYFKAQDTVLGSFTDVEEIERKAKLHGIDLWNSSQVETFIPKPKRVIHQRTPFEDPMVVAERRRQELGVSRADYHMTEHEQ